MNALQIYHSKPIPYTNFPGRTRTKRRRKLPHSSIKAPRNFLQKLLTLIIIELVLIRSTNNTIKMACLHFGRTVITWSKTDSPNYSTYIAHSSLHITLHSTNSHHLGEYFIQCRKAALCTRLHGCLLNETLYVESISALFYDNTLLSEHKVITFKHNRL